MMAHYMALNTFVMRRGFETATGAEHVVDVGDLYGIHHNDVLPAKLGIDSSGTGKYARVEISL
jgi:hypothetical protein